MSGIGGIGGLGGAQAFARMQEVQQMQGNAQNQQAQMKQVQQVTDQQRIEAAKASGSKVGTNINTSAGKSHTKKSSGERRLFSLKKH